MYTFKLLPEHDSTFSDCHYLHKQKEVDKNLLLYSFSVFYNLHKNSNCLSYNRLYIRYTKNVPYQT